MRKTHSIAVKIAFAVALIIAAYAISTATNVIQGLRAGRELAQLSSAALPSALESQAALFEFENAVKHHEDALLTGDRDALAGMSEPLARTTTLLHGIVQRRTAAGLLTPPEAAAARLLEEFKQGAPLIFDAVSTRGVNDAEVQAQLAAFRELTANARKALTQTERAQTTALRGSIDQIENATSRQRLVGVSVFAIAIAAGIGAVTLIVRRGIVRPVLRLSNDIAGEADTIKTSATQFAQASDSLSTGASQSAATLENSTAALTEITNLTRANSDRAQSAKQLTNLARTAADAGTTGMQELSTAMNAIQESSTEISKIIKTIDEIAFQTNILALNAAVEAARAGEAGAGFAVVAEEVRALAQRSATAARETAGKIEQAIQRSDQGVRLNARVGEHLSEIAGRVREVDDIISQIANASNEQNSGIANVSRSIADLDQLTQRNAALAEETSSSAHELSTQVRRLQDVAGAFAQLARGSKGASAANDADENLHQPELISPPPGERSVSFSSR